MISLDNAQKTIISNSIKGKTIKLSPQDAVNFTLAENIFSRDDIPFFNNSAMDGYAVNHEDLSSARKDAPVKLKVLGAIKAGDWGNFSVRRGEAYEIFTGAPMPRLATSVAIVENTRRKNGLVEIFYSVKKNENVRFKGEEIKRGDLIIKKGALITPEVSGIIANLGYGKVSVYKMPNIGIIVTGSEVADSKNPLKKGKIRDLNSITLSGLCANLKIKPLFIKRVSDNKKNMALLISAAVKSCDYVIITGGVSMGKYDLVRETLKNAGAREVFWKIAVKPGKPFYFCKKNKTLIFGLPGNPASVITSFYELVRPSLLHNMGHKNYFLPSAKALLDAPLKKKAGLLYIYRGHYYFKDEKIRVKILEKQGSNQLVSFIDTNCFVKIPAKISEISAGKKVDIDIIR